MSTMELRPRERHHRGGGFPGAVAAEWTKLWSLRSTWVILAAAVSMEGGYVFFQALSVKSQHISGRPDAATSSAPESAVDAVVVSQLAVIALAVLVIAGEYASGSMRTTLQWIPVRTRMLLAKCAVVAPVLFATGALMGLVGVVLADRILGQYGTPYSTGSALRAILGMGAVLALCGVLTIGFGAVLRSVAGTLTVSFVLLLALPMLLQMSKMAGIEQAVDFMPSMAGLRFMLSEEVYYPPTLGLFIVAAWAVGALIAGHVALRRRDA
ncbi:ABC transporter [Streptomyces sp. NPDC007100]|uniref:ABC transporter n=1 Tax=unclassified Streptomyces TaxID=2593676 RepID=UPI0033D71679